MAKKTKIAYITNKALATQKLGKDLAEMIVKVENKGPIVIGLDGGLGSGKTTFLQGFAKGLGIKEKILSPTFVIQKRFKIYDLRFKNFYHIDCYRLKNQNDIFRLGFKEIIENPENIVAIEWVERIKKVLSRLPEGKRGSSTKSGPKNIIIINFKFLDKNKRQIVLSGISLGGTIKNNG